MCQYGIVVEVTPFDWEDGGSRPENVKGVLHCFGYLFVCSLHGSVSLCWQAAPPSPRRQKYVKQKHIRAIYVHIRAYTSHICTYIARISFQFTYMHVFMYMHVYACIARICMYVRIWTYARIWMYMHVLHVYPYMNVCTYMNLYARINICWQIYVHIRAYTCNTYIRTPPLTYV